MKRPQLVVIRKDGTRWDANHLTVYLNNGIPFMTFMCSGQMIFAEASTVERIEFYLDGADYCNACDSPLRH